MKLKQTYMNCPPIEGGKRTSIALSKSDFDLTQVTQAGEKSKDRKEKKKEPLHYTLLGFDTEYQTEDLEQEKMSDEEREELRERLEAGDIHHEVLSYQFSTSIVAKDCDGGVLDSISSKGIIIPEGSGFHGYSQCY